MNVTSSCDVLPQAPHKAEHDLCERRGRGFVEEQAHGGATRGRQTSAAVGEGSDIVASADRRQITAQRWFRLDLGESSSLIPPTPPSAADV